MKDTLAKLKLVSSKYSKQDSKAYISFSKTIDIKLATDSHKNHTFTLKDMMNGIEIDAVLDKHIFVEVVKDGLVISFSQDLSLIEAELEIKKAGSQTAFIASDGREVFDEYPITVSKIIPTSSSAKAAETAAVVMSSVTTTSVVVVMSASPPIAVILVKVLAHFFFIRLLNAPRLVYPSMILDATSDMNILPIPVKNYFKDWADSYQCQVHQVFVKRELECNLLSNYGEDIIIIYSMLLVNLIITLQSKARTTHRSES